MNMSAIASTPVAQVEDLETMWLEYLRIEKNLAPNTLVLYGRTLRQFRIDVPNFRNAETETIRDWLYSLGGEAGTISNRISGLRSFYRWLVRTKRRLDNPMEGIDAPKKLKGLPKPVKDIEEVLRIFDAEDARINARLANNRKHLRPLGQTRAMAMVLMETGLRIHEAVALDVPVPAPALIAVIGKGRKEALIPLTDAARQALDFLGGKWPVGARATQRRFERAHTNPHAFRHHLGCSLPESGADLGEIQDILRHSSPATTRTYAAYSTERLRAAHARRAAM